MSELLRLYCLPVEEEFQAVVNLLSYCDESGKEHEHDIVVFNALVSGYEGWNNFANKWIELLNRYELDAFTSKEAFRHSQPYGAMEPGTGEKRASDILPFVQAIVEGVNLGVIGAIDVRAYKLPNFHKIRLYISDDPHYFAFHLVIGHILNHYRVPKDLKVGLVLDDDEAKAMLVYKFLARIKKSEGGEEVKRRVPSICFMDDKVSPQLQAADLFTSLCRLRAEKMFLGKENPYFALSDAFDVPPFNVRGGLYGEEELRSYLEMQIRKRQVNETKI